MKVFSVIFGLFTIMGVVGAFWNPGHIITAFCCLIMTINCVSHIKESV